MFQENKHNFYNVREKTLWLKPKIHLSSIKKKVKLNNGPKLTAGTYFQECLKVYELIWNPLKKEVESCRKGNVH